MTSDGKSQRNALTAAERAIEALGRGQAERAVTNADKAASLDQIGVFADFPAAVRSAAGEIAERGSVGPAGWDGVSAAVGPGPLAFLVAEQRDD